MTLPARLALDTNCFIYLFEESEGPRGRFLAREVFAHLVSGARTAVTSTLTLAELLARPYERGQRDRAGSLRAALVATPNLTLKSLDAETADRAAALRGRHGLSLADAVQVATGILDGAEALLTNDRRLAREGLPLSVLVLDDVADT